MLQNIAFFSGLLPLAFFFIFKKNNKKREIKVIFIYLLYNFLNDAVAYYLIRMAHYDPYILYDIFTIAELVFFCIFYLDTIKTKFIKKIIFLIIFCFIIYSIVDYFFISQNKSFNSTTSGAEAIIIILMCLYYFYAELKQVTSALIYTTKNFWVIIAFLIFLSGTFFLYIYTENMVQDNNFKTQYSIINSSFLVLKNILFSIAMIIKPTMPPAQIDLPNEKHFSSDFNSIQPFKNLN